MGVVVAVDHTPPRSGAPHAVRNGGDAFALVVVAFAAGVEVWPATGMVDKHTGVSTNLFGECAADDDHIPATSDVALSPISPVTGSMGLPVPMMAGSFRSIRPPLPKVAMGAPVFASRATS
jgi:hypothetical protein